MLYISEVKVRGEAQSRVSDLYDFVSPLELTVLDTESSDAKSLRFEYKLKHKDRKPATTGTDYRVKESVFKDVTKRSFWPFKRQSYDILGLKLPSEKDDNVICLPMSVEDLKFHQFAESSVSVASDVYTIAGADILTSEGKFTKSVHETNKLVVLVDDAAIEMFGYCGSIVVRSELSQHRLGRDVFTVHDKIYTLRDFVLYLCSKCGICVMNYDEVKIVTPPCFNTAKDHIISTIKFTHTAEANRYFAKLYMLEALRR